MSSFWRDYLLKLKYELPWGLLGVRGDLSGVDVLCELLFGSGVLGGGIGLGAGLSVVLSAGGSSKVLSIGTCCKCGARWCLHTCAYSLSISLVSPSPSKVNHSSTGSLPIFILADLPTLRMPSLNTLVIGLCLPSLQISYAVDNSYKKIQVK